MSMIRIDSLSNITKTFRFSKKLNYSIFQGVILNSQSMSTSAWAHVPQGPLDPILGLTEKFNKDTDPRKVSLGVGAYRTDEGKPYLLPSVLEAEKRILASGANKEYAGISGMKDFVALALKFAYGEDCEALSDGRIAGVQTISGTGACRLAGDFFKKYLEGSSIYLPNPTWGNHIPIMKDAGLTVKRYTYYDPSTGGVDINGIIKDMAKAQEGSIFLLHACAHNPTGADPSMKQWMAISDIMKKKKLIPFFDCAYQGFASGDADRDAQAIRHFVKEGHNMVLAQSFAKNFGLYGERVGALSFVTKDAEEASRVESQLKIIIRPMYSNPPIHGSLIVRTVLEDEGLTAQWRSECKGMAKRILEMRELLRKNIEAQESTRSWNHITDQIGMFCYTGLTESQVSTIIDDFHIYMTKDGRISIAGVNSKNVEYVAKSIASVVSSSE